METKKFKCKDEVIYRRTDEKSEWAYGIFSHYCENSRHAMVNGLYILLDSWKILPYEGNEELVGTTDEPDEEVRLEEGEYYFFCDSASTNADHWSFGKLKNISSNDFSTIRTTWNYAIRFSDFNPSNMEETKKHILCVKNGKVVRYKNN